MPETLTRLLEHLVTGISAATALVLACGVLYGLVWFGRAEFLQLTGRPCDTARAQIRKQVGFYLLFGIELLIAADIIETMIDPSIERVGVLGAIAVLRILIGYALSREIAELASAE